MRKLETLLNELVPGRAADVSEIVDEIQEMTASSTQYALRYPMGKTMFNDNDTTEYRDNYDIACEIMEGFLAGGSVILPQPVEAIDGNRTNEWEILEYGPHSGCDWDWTTDHHILEPGKRWKITDATGKEFQNVRKLNSNTGFIEQTGPSDGPIYVRTLAPLPITVEQVDIK